MDRPSNPPGTPVALYLRRSDDQKQEESIETQRRGAVQYCDARGWVIVEEFVDGEERRASRAEFQKRPALIRMLNHAKRKNFELVVARDETRLGGDMQRTGLAMQNLVDAGVGIVYYISDELVEMDSAVNKFLVVARNFASELEREKIVSRTHENLLQKAKAGKSPGGICFGYSIEAGHYTVKDGEAEVVRAIFADYLSGRGLRAIAYKLNRSGVAPPRAGRRGGPSWQHTAVRFILANPRYIGEARYNQTRNAYRGGTKVVERRAAAEHVSYGCPAIVDRATWDAVQLRIANAPRFGTPTTKGAAPRYLLSGISRCAKCGGPMTVKMRKAGSPIRAYICGWHKDRGPATCPSSVSELCDRVDQRVLAKVREYITQDVLADVVREVRAAHAAERASMPAEHERLRGIVDGLKREIGRLTNALATLDSPPPSLLQALAERDTRLRQAELELAAASATAETADRTLDEIELVARRKLRELTEQLQKPETARRALEALIDEKMRFEAAPDGGFVVKGVVNLAGLLAPDCVESRTGPNAVRLPGRLAFVA